MRIQLLGNSRFRTITIEGPSGGRRGSSKLLNWRVSHAASTLANAGGIFVSGMLGGRIMFKGSGLRVFCIFTFGWVSVLAAASDVADAAKRGDTAAVRALLTQKADVNAPQPDGATALHWAAWQENVELAATLLRAGANPMAVNSAGATPLSLAAASGNAAI